VNTVSVHVHRGIKKLRELFNENNGWDKSYK
jgi:hypothetical protein